MNKSLGAIGAAALVTLVAAGCSKADNNKKQAHADPATPVHVHQVKPHSVDVYSTFSGRAKAYRQATVVARVSGILKSRHYQEGHKVHKGQLLYQINPSAYQAVVDKDKAKLASDRATLKKDERAWHRIHHLYKSNAVSQSKRDTALSDLEVAKAQIKQDKASLKSDKITLGYTHVTAPLTGVTSLRQTDVGSLVSNGTKLTTITKLNPVYVRFALPENAAVAHKKAMQEHGKKTTNAATRQATIILRNGKKFPYKGKVDFTQSTINQQTGTVNMRAVVKNPNNQLMPGRYVRVRIRVATLSNAIVVPDKAVFTGQSRSYVLIVNNGKAKKKVVKLGPDVANGRVIKKGLSAGDSVVISGLGTIKPGASVKVVNKAKGDSGSKGKSKKTASIENPRHNDNYQMAGADNLTHGAAAKQRAS